MSVGDNLDIRQKGAGNLDLTCTTPDLHIAAGIITAGFMRTDSDVPSLPVMSLKMKK